MLAQRVDPTFQKLLLSFDQVNIEAHTSPVYGVWKDFSLAYFNPAWYAFAQDNQGEPVISEEWNLGRNVMDAVPPDLRAFYTEFFRSSFNGTGKQVCPSQLEYECSSADQYRTFHMTLYSIGQNEGILVVNALIQEKPFEQNGEDREVIASIYTDENGIIHQCSHCRKVKNLKSEKRWDWIPAWVRNLPPSVSHGLCGFCLDYFYPPVSDS